MRLNHTSYSHIIDSYAWIEYFKASNEGENAKRYVEDEGSATPSIVVAEVSGKLLKEVEAGRETREQRTGHLEFIRSTSQILPLTFDTAAKAGEIDVEMKKRVRGWGLADSIILTLTRSANAKVVTGDEHFRSLKEAVLIKEKAVRSQRSTSTDDRD